jgi:predicted ATPase
LQAAAEVSERFPDGVTWLPLAPLRDPAVVLPALAGALGIADEPGRPLAESLSSRLVVGRALLLLDDCEHLLPAVAEKVARLRDLGGPTVLVTSRDRLRLQGEQVYAVPPLAEADAVELFVTRGRALAVDVDGRPELVEPCERLDRLPLALELAAACTPLFSPRQLDRLSGRLDLLRGGRDADPRQQTLRAAIGWSYELLDPVGQRALQALSVFRGGSTYEAAEEVSSAGPDVLQSLVDKSLLRRWEGGRLGMLEIIRESPASSWRRRARSRRSGVGTPSGRSAPRRPARRPGTDRRRRSGCCARSKRRRTSVPRSSTCWRRGLRTTLRAS